MFELTGALTYILPTMIVLLVTKAVGDFLGTHGIADEMIRFNGYPFLEKEDHAFNVSVSNVMKKDLHTLPVSGIRVCDLEDKLASTQVKGFPIISSGSVRTLQGYIGRTELCYVLDNARELGDISPDKPCSFMCDTTDHGVPGLSPGTAIGVEEDVAGEIIETTVSSDILKFWPWVNQTPLTVSPQLPLEIVMQLFKSMGPRAILVEDHGLLAGLVTVKDVLKFTAMEKPNGDASWGELRGGLDGLLEETYTWTIRVVDTVASWFRGLVRR